MCNYSILTRLKGAPIPKKIHIWKAYLTLEIGKEDKISKILWFQHITEVPTHYCIQQFILSSKILCPHFLLIYTALLTCCGRIIFHSVQPLLKHWGVCNTVIQIILKKIIRSMYSYFMRQNSKMHIATENWYSASKRFL